MLKILIALLVVIGQEGSAFAGQRFYSWTGACAAAESVVAEGDLVFLDIPNVLFRKVAAGTNTWTSHVGIVFKDDNGDWIVAESTVPLSRNTPLCDFLRRSSKFNFEIRRLARPLTPDEIEGLRATAWDLLNRFYDFGFNFDSDRLFCSKFVYLTFESIGIQVGRPQTFRELLEDNPEVSLAFWRFWFFGSIPWERRTVTPASQLNDPKFLTILRGD